MQYQPPNLQAQILGLSTAQKMYANTSLMFMAKLDKEVDNFEIPKNSFCQYRISGSLV